MAGGKDTLGEMISGAAIEKRFGMHPRELGKDHEVWEELARVAAYGIHNTILHWSPDRVVIGGSMMNEIGIPVERIRHHLTDIMHKFPTLPDIVHSELGDLGGLWGGLALLKQERA
jgi:predicted NBD/HSP70 family sugar kinase